MQLPFKPNIFPGRAWFAGFRLQGEKVSCFPGFAKVLTTCGASMADNQPQLEASDVCVGYMISVHTVKKMPFMAFEFQSSRLRCDSAAEGQIGAQYSKHGSIKELKQFFKLLNIL